MKGEVYTEGWGAGEVKWRNLVLGLSMAMQNFLDNDLKFFLKT